MLKIQKLRADPVIDFAAEELKKYLRMMMPRCGEIPIAYDPEAVAGFRLGLLEDFSLPCEAEDPVLDDVIHIDTNTDGGILAGSNPRSVLFAVYRYLRLNGCRWLYPGIDGEYIPITPIVPQKYHKLADHRFRGHCNEGAESQQCMLETIDFFAKQELNVYMIEFDIPFYYYNTYYAHHRNEKNRTPEPVSPDQVLQWKRQCEAEIAKRGLQMHDMGHGWTAEPFGIPSTDGWVATEASLTKEQIGYLAQIDGKRQLFGGVPLNTNVCMSNPKVRAKMVRAIADYAENAQNVSYLHVWLADGRRNHCECDACQKMRPSDFYMMLMNELDEELSARKLDTRIVFIAYVDTLYGPEYVKIQNPQRFSLLYAPIYRSYSSSITEDSVIPPAPDYVRNHWQSPLSAEENLTFLRQWQENWHGCAFEYEYHFWRYQYLDPGALYFARRVWEDIRSLKIMGLDGVVEDGSQRSFFPNGFCLYVYAETLMDRNCDFDAVARDYFSHIYGEDWQQVLELLQQVSDIFDYPWMAGEASEDPKKGDYYAPSRAQKLDKIPALADQAKAIAAAHRVMPTRPQTVSMQLLGYYAEYIRCIGSILRDKALGNDEAAALAEVAFEEAFGKYEMAIERYFDHYLATRTLQRITGKPVTLQEGWA